MYVVIDTSHYGTVLANATSVAKRVSNEMAASRTASGSQGLRRAFSLPTPPKWSAASRLWSQSCALAIDFTVTGSAPKGVRRKSGSRSSSASRSSLRVAATSSRASVATAPRRRRCRGGRSRSAGGRGSRPARRRWASWLDQRRRRRASRPARRSRPRRDW